MAASDYGAYGIAQGFKTILQTNLQDVMDTVKNAAVADGIYSGTLTAPDTARGYSTSLYMYPRDIHNGIQLWVSDVRIEKRHIHTISTTRPTIGLRYFIQDKDLEQMEAKKLLGVHSLFRCIEQYWRTIEGTHAIYDVRVRQDERYASSKVKGLGTAIVGMKATNPGVYDSAALIITCKQQCSTPVNFS